MTNQVDPAKPGSDLTVVSSLQGRGAKGRPIRIWRGRWYKPWTWFRWVTAYKFDEYQLISWSVVRSPGPNRNGDSFDPRLFNDVLAEPYRPMEHSDGPRLPRSSPLE